jgi:hypothetical protein
MTITCDPSGGAHDDTPGAADPRVQLADRVCEAHWTPPPRHVLGICPRLKDEVTRRIEYAGDDHLALCDVLVTSFLLCSGTEIAA